MAVSRDEVILGFRLILGREPDSESAIAAHMDVPDLASMARVLFQSAEFSQNTRFKDFLQVDGAAGPRPGRASPQTLNVVVLGNCQAKPIRALSESGPGSAAFDAAVAEQRALQSIVCDEEAIEGQRGSGNEMA
jgi:hypothetical protein